MPEEVGVVRRLNELRRERLQTIRELATRAGVSTRTVLRVEHGVQTPHPSTMKKLATALDVDPAQVHEFRAAMGLPPEGSEQS